MTDYRTEYNRWLKLAEKEEDLCAELRSMDDSRIEDAFYRNLAFGTGGLRGVIGAGTNRMNVFTVGKASQGLANYIGKTHKNSKGSSIAVAYDSRIKSREFAETACSVFAANGIRAYLYPELVPTPCLSYAVRKLGCSAGVMVTASHNPAEYNGYKVYGPDGCQITTEAAAAILAEIEELDIFEDVKSRPFGSLPGEGLVEYIPDSVYDDFTAEVKGQSVLFGDEVNRNVAIVYSPLNGTGLKPVTRVLEESGFTNITVVAEQEQPDGSFPTCPCPNPEIREAMELGLLYCERTGADLLLATDPDCDRCGIAVRTPAGGYRLLSGNEVGLLLLDFICSRRIRHNQMPADPVFVKTIVTTDLAEKIADHYGVRTVNVLTGFKFIGEVIGRLESAGAEKDFICGFEESYGYLTGSYVRDKDAVDAAFMIAEMFAFYKTRGVSLLDKLDELYKTYGYCLNTLHSYEFPGSSGMAEMQEIMESFRRGVDRIGKENVIKTEDYSAGLNGLPPSDVLKYFFEGEGGVTGKSGGNKQDKSRIYGSVVVRPSGTEPRLKTYISITAENEGIAREAEQKIVEQLQAIMRRQAGVK